MRLRSAILLLSCVSLLVFAFHTDTKNNGAVSAFLPSMPLSIDLLNGSRRNNRLTHTKNVLILSSSKTPSPPPTTTTTATVDDIDDDESPLNPVGAKFFGGSVEKEELFDPDIEKKASSATIQLGYNRFQDTEAFPEGEAGLATCIAQRLQSSIHSILFPDKTVEGDTNNNDRNNTAIAYSSNLKWSSPFLNKNNNNPLQELECARKYYRQVDISILKASTPGRDRNDRVVELRWIISLKWPNLWESQVTLTGTSLLTLNSDQKSPLIVTQEDYLDNGGIQGKDLMQSMAWQLLPRFWDVYHIGMTPSAELLTRLRPEISSSSFLKNYELFEIPPRLVIQSSILDATSRDRRRAQLLPNHAFSCTIVTAGKDKQRYVPTTPVEVRIVSVEDEEGKSSTAMPRPLDSDDTSSATRKSTTKRRITWTIPVPAFVSSAFCLPVPTEMNNNNSNSNLDKYYVVEGRRRVATCKYSGYAQDEQVVKIRKQLYESVVRDGLRPKLDKRTGKPIFFFLQNKVKGCFTKEGGLGMAVYESRPKLFSSDEVGIELEI
jgi:hypothetical protein